MLRLTHFGCFLVPVPLVWLEGFWTGQEMEWLVLGIEILLALLMGCVMVAAIATLLCSLALMLRALFDKYLLRKPLSLQLELNSLPPAPGSLPQ